MSVDWGESLNDHQQLRHDMAMQTAVGKSDKLASQSTLCRLERKADNLLAWHIHEVLFKSFVNSHKEPPKRLVLDVDATDIEVHGNQPQRFFHGYYDHYCYLPLYVYCGHHLLVAYLRPSKIDGAKHTWGILSLLVKRLRQQWPEVEIVLRGDSGFCRHRMLSWCDRKEVNYVVGMARNARLECLAKPYLEQAKQAYDEDQEPHRVYTETTYAAHSWDRERRLIIKAEHLAKGPNPRFVITNLPDRTADDIYENEYCARGEMENRIKEQQYDLFATRTSSTQWWTNQLRLLLAALAYTLLHHIRTVALADTALAKATCHTIRLKLLKIGAIILRNTRRVRFHLATHHPHQHLFMLACRRLLQ